MYETFFQLQDNPFPATPFAASYFPAQSIESARQSLVRVVERAEGPGLIVGPPGVGKSLLLKVLSDHFASVYRTVPLFGTRIATRKSLLQNVLFELGLAYRGMDEGELRLALIDALRPSNACPNGILLLLDEAHTLPLRLLDELRLISNVVRDGQPRARLVLAGGPPLEEHFTSPKLASFSQRVAARCYLQSFSRDETHEYVRAQITWVGGDPDSIFELDAFRAIFQASDGIPRLINQVCDHALVLAQAMGVRRVSGHLIQEAWADLQQLPPPWQPPQSAPASPDTSVIEFGELTDESERTAALATPRIPERVNAEVASMVEESSDGDDLAAPWLNAVPYYPDAQWIEGSSAAASLIEFNRVANPFAVPFDEEVVVLDRELAWEIEAFRGRPRVSCLGGSELVSELKAMARAASLAPESRDSREIAPDDLDELPSEAAVRSQVAIGAGDEPALGFTTLTAGAGDDLDEEIDCVPLPWTRGTLGDDRDMIVVEEDLADPGQANVAGAGATRRVEYRELFAQLRRTP